MIVSEKVVNFMVISCEIAEITWIKHKREFTTYNYGEEWFCEMLKTAFERKFSVNAISLIHH